MYSHALLTDVHYVKEASYGVKEVLPGVKCPTCEAKGITQWVIRGKVCPKCGTECI